MLIRLKGGFPEGVMFAILIMNCFAPLIDRSFKAKVFGAVKQTKAKEIKQ
jgi:electron transport complex protein RnfD